MPGVGNKRRAPITAQHAVCVQLDAGKEADGAATSRRMATGIHSARNAPIAEGQVVNALNGTWKESKNRRCPSRELKMNTTQSISREFLRDLHLQILTYKENFLSYFRVLMVSTLLPCSSICPHPIRERERIETRRRIGVCYYDS